MEKKIKFNDEFVKPRIEKLLNIGIQKRIITNDQIEEVKKVLEIDGDNFDEVQAKRNSVVKLLSDDLHSQNTMSGVTFVLDSRL